MVKQPRWSTMTRREMKFVKSGRILAIKWGITNTGMTGYGWQRRYRLRYGDGAAMKEY